MRFILFSLGIASSCFASPNNGFSYNDLVRLIQERRISSIEALLPNLPQSFRSHYTLMRKSRSLQDASDKFPRAILFGETAQLTCSFNGEPSQLGYDLLECIQFIREERRFDFRQIQFPTVQNRLTQVRFSESGKSADGKISCAKCHSADPRPNWNDNYVWPGAFGQSIDSLINADDLNAYSEFVSLRPNHSRYKWLIQGPQLLDPYMAGDDDGHRGMDNAPNQKYGGLTNRWNAYRAARLLEAKVPRWAVLAFAAKALDCEATPDQIKAFSKVGLNYVRDSEIGSIFGALNLTNSEWSTQIRGDLPDHSDRPVWDHAASFAFLAELVGVAVAQEEADAGNLKMKRAIAGFAEDLRKNPNGEQYDKFARILNGILPGPNRRGQAYIPVELCQEISSVFAKEYLRHGRVQRY